MREEKQAPAHQEHVVLGMAAAMGAYFMFSVMVLFAVVIVSNILIVWRESRLMMNSENIA